MTRPFLYMLSTWAPTLYQMFPTIFKPSDSVIVCFIQSPVTILLGKHHLICQSVRKEVSEKRQQLPWCHSSSHLCFVLVERRLAAETRPECLQLIIWRQRFILAVRTQLCCNVNVSLFVGGVTADLLYVSTSCLALAHFVCFGINFTFVILNLKTWWCQTEVGVIRERWGKPRSK